MPTMNSGTPSQVMSNIPSGPVNSRWPPQAAGMPAQVRSSTPQGRARPAAIRSSTRPATITLVLVPISVHKPPSTTAEFIGIRSFETLSRFLRAHSRIAGTSRATTGVLFMNAETMPGPTMVRSWAAESDRGRPRTRSTITASAPVRSTPAATMNSAATEIIPSLAMP